jgi:hypothetical protein
MKKTITLLLTSILIVIAGCGGGGSSPVTQSNTVVNMPVLYATSYQNAKSEGLAAFTLPAEATSAAAYARANFKTDGKFTLFTATSTYDPVKPPDQATRSVMAFWTAQADGSWLKESTLIDNPAGCIVPRKAVVADFNGDGKPDILLACHGYDAAPFPGERMFMVESTASGVYHAHPLGDFVGFFHGASAADLDGDGLIDIVVTDSAPRNAVRVFKNLGNAVFQEVQNAVPSSLKPGYFSLELIDVDGDGKVDLVMGGHEYDGNPTQIIFNSGSGFYANGSIKVLPADTDAGVVLDFVKSGTKLFVGRTSGSLTDPSIFYKRLGLQTIDLTSLATLTVTIKDSPLFYWLLPSSNGVISDRIDRPL